MHMATKLGRVDIYRMRSFQKITRVLDQMILIDQEVKYFICCISTIARSITI